MYPAAAMQMLNKSARYLDIKAKATAGAVAFVVFRYLYRTPLGPIASKRFFRSAKKPLATYPSTTR